VADASVGLRSVRKRYRGTHFYANCIRNIPIALSVHRKDLLQEGAPLFTRVKDALGNETDYTYDAANGKVLTVMRPSVATSAYPAGVRPQTNYTYTQQAAWVLTATAGQYVASSPIWVLSTESYCLTSPATTDSSTGQVDCAAGADDKVLKTYYYGPNSGPNNLFLRGVQVQASGATHVTCYGYDPLGHQVSVTTPSAGLSLSSCDQFTQN
jgi:hypothetical protein